MGGSVGKLLLKLQTVVAWKWRQPVLQLEQAPESEPEKPLRMLRVHISRGSFFCCGADDDRGAPPMDAEVWGKLPEELIWEVVRFVSAAKLFQLHLVSREWHRVLTSPDFRKRVTAGARRESDHDHEEEELPYTRVVGCMEKVRLHGDNSSASWSLWRWVLSSNSRSIVKEENWKKKKVAVVDIDLSSLVPTWLWSKHKYSVVAAGDSLVCISNNSEVEHQVWCEPCRSHYVQQSPIAWREHWKPWANRYCVLNPLTCTCVVLPELVLPVLPDHEWWPPGAVHKWLPPTASALTAYAFDWVKEELHVATYNLAAGGGGGWVSVTHKPGTSLFWNLDKLVVLASRSSDYWARHQKQARALHSASTGTMDDPSVASSVASSLCLDASSTQTWPSWWRGPFHKTSGRRTSTPAPPRCCAACGGWPRALAALAYSRMRCWRGSPWRGCGCKTWSG